MDCRHREAAAPRERPPVLRSAGVRRHHIQPVLVGGLEQTLPDAAPTESQLLSARHRPEGQVAGTARQRLRYPSHQ